MRAPSFFSPLPPSEWPTADLEAWRRALGDDPLQPGGMGGASAWRPATREIVQRGYGAWLVWLRHKGRLGLDGGAEPATRANVREYLADMRWAGYSDYSAASRLTALAAALRVMSPALDSRFISRAAGRVAARAHRARDIPSRVRPPEEIVELGRQLMGAADCDQLGDVDRAMLFRDGLLLTLIVYRPLRIANLAMIELDRHLVRTSIGFRLQFEGSDMKSHRPYSCAWPQALEEALERYLRGFRPILHHGQARQGGTPRLWVGRHGQALKQRSVANILRKRTTAAFGTALGPHILRHILGTTLAEHAPENVTEVCMVLGHQSLETSQRHYIHASALEAGRRLHEALAAEVARHRNRGH